MRCKQHLGYGLKFGTLRQLGITRLRNSSLLQPQRPTPKLCEGSVKCCWC